MLDFPLVYLAGMSITMFHLSDFWFKVGFTDISLHELREGDGFRVDAMAQTSDKESLR